MASGERVSATAASGTGTGNYLTFRSNGYGSSTDVTVLSSRGSSGGDWTGIGNVTATHTSPGGETGAGSGEAGLDVVETGDQWRDRLRLRPGP